MSWRTHLRLGRVSNLPTVWTNVLAGAVLAGEDHEPVPLLLLAASLTLFYAGGMYLNDAFDHRIDARERSDRPIPAGEISARSVFAIGGGLLAGGWLLLVPAAPPAHREGTLIAGGALGVVILLYDVWHKGNPLSPVLMGLTRALVYVTAALAVGGKLGAEVLGGALLLWAYLIGLTYAAKQETLARVRNLWPLAFLGAPLVAVAPLSPAGTVEPVIYVGLLAWVAYALRLLLRGGRSIPRGVVSLIAGISLLDALLIARQGETALALAAVLGFALTLLFQRVVAGT